MEAQAASEEEVRIEVAEDERGIRHRGVTAALAVAGGTGHRAGARRPHPEQPRLVDRGDAAAAGADDAHVDGGEAGHVAAVRRADPRLARPRDPRPADEAHVVARAAGIRHDGGVGTPFGHGVRAARHRRHGRPGLHRVDRGASDVAGLHHAALRRHHHHGAGEPRGPQPGAHALEVLAHQRLERGVDAGRRGAPVLADRRVHGVRQAHRHTWQMSGE